MSNKVNNKEDARRMILLQSEKVFLFRYLFEEVLDDTFKKTVTWGLSEQGIQG